VRELKAQASFIFVSHRLSEVLELYDRIYVRKDGAVAAELQATEADVKTLHRLKVARGGHVTNSGSRTTVYRRPARTFVLPAPRVPDGLTKSPFPSRE
jgi:ABC-type sugar transport system ATPase subunit